MDGVLKKKLSTFLSESGRLTNVSDDVLIEILDAWENWTGTAKDFYKSIGFTHRQMAKLIGKAKKLKREGFIGENEFAEVKVHPHSEVERAASNYKIEVLWKGRVIRFDDISLLDEVLKKVA